jgi:hypothetical protein
MPVMKVWDDTKGRGSCNSCGAAITWFQLTSGKRHPFDGEPSYVRTAQADGRLVGEIDTSISSSHFASCPQAGQWRRRK